MLAFNLRFGASGHRQVEIQDFSSGQAAAFNAVPAANHFSGHAEILCYRLDRIALADLVMRNGAGVGAAVRLFAGSDRDDQPGLGRNRIQVESIVAAPLIKVVRLGNRSRSGVIGAGNGSWGFSGLSLVLTPG